jgi:hypothetical protein
MRDTIDMAREAGFELGKVFVNGVLVDATTTELKAFEALVRADERDKPVTPVEYIPADEHVCSYNECGFCEDPNCNVYGDAAVMVTMPPMTNEGADANISLAFQLKGGGEIKLKGGEQ